MHSCTRAFERERAPATSPTTPCFYCVNGIAVAGVLIGRNSSSTAICTIACSALLAGEMLGPCGCCQLELGRQCNHWRQSLRVTGIGVLGNIRDTGSALALPGDRARSSRCYVTVRYRVVRTNSEHEELLTVSRSDSKVPLTPHEWAFFRVKVRPHHEGAPGKAAVRSFAFASPPAT